VVSVQSSGPVDLWAHQWRTPNARGDVILTRFADDYIVGFERHEDAERFLADLRGRFAKFGLELHPENRVRPVRC
jgi:RNA-directed DNA polymerase